MFCRKISGVLVWLVSWMNFVVFFVLFMNSIFWVLVEYEVVGEFDGWVSC